VDQILDRLVHLIRNQLGCYHVGIFLIDETLHYLDKQWVWLSAATGDITLQTGHDLVAKSLPRDTHDSSIACKVILNGRGRIALDVGENAVYFTNPLLPNARSEITLPLISNGQVIGALDFQSAEEAAFSLQDITMLQPVADKVAGVIQAITDRKRP
jgi:GAF domain-containing protein